MEEDAATAGRGHCDNSLSIPFKVDWFSPDTFVVVEVFLGNKAFAFFHILEDKECGGALVEAISTGPFDPSQGTGQFFLDEPVSLFPLFHFYECGKYGAVNDEVHTFGIQVIGFLCCDLEPFFGQLGSGFYEFIPLKLSVFFMGFPHSIYGSWDASCQGTEPDFFILYPS